MTSDNVKQGNDALAYFYELPVMAMRLLLMPFIIFIQLPMYVRIL